VLGIAALDDVLLWFASPVLAIPLTLLLLLVVLVFVFGGKSLTDKLFGAVKTATESAVANVTRSAASSILKKSNWWLIYNYQYSESSIFTISVNSISCLYLKMEKTLKLDPEMMAKASSKMMSIATNNKLATEKTITQEKKEPKYKRKQKPLTQ